MKIPALHTATEIRALDSTTIIDGKWELARPEPYYSWKSRWKLAWMVFIGKADAVTWNKQ